MEDQSNHFWLTGIRKTGLWLLILTAIISLNAQHSDNNQLRQKLEFLVGYGGRNINIAELDASYEYDVRIFEVQYSYALIYNQKFGLEVLCNPQINSSNYKGNSNDQEIIHGMEWGFTLGVSPRFHTRNKNLAIYTLLSSGPVYITGSPERQSHGLNFASNFLAGIQLRIYKNTFIDVRSGFRHLSNANIQLPNAGINSLIFSGGLAFAF